MTQKTRFPPKIDAPVGTCCRRNVISCGAAARKGETTLTQDLIVVPTPGRSPSSKAQVARHATASKISFPPPSTTTVRPEPTAECRLVLRLPGGCRLGARTGHRATRRPRLSGSRQGLRLVDRHPQAAHARHLHGLQGYGAPARQSGCHHNGCVQPRVLGNVSEVAIRGFGDQNASTHRPPTGHKYPSRILCACGPDRWASDLCPPDQRSLSSPSK